MFRIICLLMGYCFGCLQSAYIIGKLMGKIDIREHGSGNAGTTNITRILGPKAGAIVFLFDILKGSVVFILCSIIFHGDSVFTDGVNGLLPGLYAGFGAVLGHNFPFFLNFKGGKGIATTIGIIMFLSLPIMLIDYALGFITVFSTKYISAAALIITLAFPILLLIFNYPLEPVILGLCFTLMAWFQHRGNIDRIIHKTERKFDFGKNAGK